MLTRRKLISCAARAGLLAGTAPMLLACSEDERPGTGAGVTPLAQYALAMQAIAYIGPLCIEKSGFAATDDSDSIRQALTRELEGRLSAAGTEQDLAPSIDALIREDFAGGRIIDVDGWQLSETECRLAALAAATQGRRSPAMPELSPERAGTVVEVSNWGPQSTPQREVFNEQADGHAGLWFKAENAPASAVIVFDGKVQATQVYAGHMTSGIHGKHMEEVINTPGVYTVELLDRARRIRQPIGEFRVIGTAGPQASAGAAAMAACTVQSWGPDRGSAGKPFNEQPGGASAFWVRTDCALPGSELILEGVPLKTTVRDRLLTATVPEGHKLAPGSYELLVRVGGGERLVRAGDFRVQP
jgi:hypothetical protein